MMPKVTMKANTPGYGGVIHASASGRTYHHDRHGHVTVDSVDVKDLLGTHHVVPNQDASPGDTPTTPISSVSPGSQEAGATALDPAKRETFHREVDLGTGQQNQDFGAATPPHGLPDDSVSSAADAEAKQVEAQEEVNTAAGADAEHRSAQPGTGQMSTVASNKQAQADVRGEGPDDADDADDPANVTPSPSSLSKPASTSDGSDPIAK